MQCSSVASCVHVLLEILVTVLEHEHQLRLGVDHVVESQDIDVLEFLEQGNFADCGARRSLLRVKVNLLERHNLICRS